VFAGYTLSAGRSAPRPGRAPGSSDGGDFMGDKQNVRVDTGFGIVWFIGWLFTIGYLKLQFWTGVLAMIIWPYYLGASFR